MAEKKSFTSKVGTIIVVLVLIAVVVPIALFTFNKVTAVYNVLFSSTNKEVLLEKQKIENSKLDEALKIQKEFNAIDTKKEYIDKEVTNGINVFSDELMEDTKRLMRLLDSNKTVSVKDTNILDKGKEVVVKTIHRNSDINYVKNLVLKDKPKNTSTEVYTINKQEYIEEGNKNYLLMQSIRKTVMKH